MIYFIQRSDTNLIKIGWTDRTAGERMKVLWSQTRHAPLKGLGICYGGRIEEGLIHGRFRHIRADGEWFLPADELMTFIGSECSPWNSQACDNRHAPLDPVRPHIGIAVTMTYEDIRILDRLTAVAGVPRGNILRRIYLFWRHHDPDGTMVTDWSWHPDQRLAGPPCPTPQVSDQ